MGRPAAFFRLEGPLARRSVALAAATLGASAQHLRERAVRFGAALLAAPVAWGTGDGATATRLAWSALRGTTRDRVRVLGEEYAEETLVPALRPEGVDLLEQCRRDGCFLVLVSDHVEEIARPVADHLRVDLLLANRLEYAEGDADDARATGRLRDPLVGRLGGPRLAEVAERHGLDLARSRAYGAAGDDQLLLAGVGLPCAVFPDRSLRRVATDLDWPVVEGP